MKPEAQLTGPSGCPRTVLHLARRPVEALGGGKAWRSFILDITGQPGARQVLVLTFAVARLVVLEGRRIVSAGARSWASASRRNPRDLTDLWGPPTPGARGTDESRKEEEEDLADGLSLGLSKRPG